METLEQLKGIVKNAPDGATHYNKKGEYKYLKLTYFNGYQAFVNGESTINVMPNKLYGLRSLSDVKLIIELMELNQNMHTTVAGYLWGKDWAHWNEFNAGKFKL